jgi:hypothetical protein
MTPDIVERFLGKMLPGWPWAYSPRQREFLLRDTDMVEIKRFAPELAREYGS